MKNIKIKIKKATIRDLNPFWELFSESVKNQFPEYSPKTKNFFLKKAFSKKELRKDLKYKNIIILLALSGREMAGYLLGLRPYGGVSYISWIAVKNSFQNKGIGSRLLKEYEFLAQKQGVHKIHLWTDERNLKFYKKEGYKLVGCIPQNYFGANDWLFYKKIQKPK